MDFDGGGFVGVEGGVLFVGRGGGGGGGRGGGLEVEHDALVGVVGVAELDPAALGLFGDHALDLLPFLDGHHDLAGDGALVGADDAGDAHEVDEAGGAGVADGQAALEQGDGTAPGFEDDLDGAVEHGVFLGGGEGGGGVVLAGQDAVLVGAAGGAHLHEGAFEGWRGDLLEELDDLADLLVVHQGSLAAVELVAGGGEVEHVALAEQQFAALLVEHDAAVHAGGDLEGDAAGHVGLDQAGDHVGLRALGGQDQVDAHRAGLLGDADDRALDLLVGHHQVGQLVDDEDHVGEFAGDAGGFLVGGAVEGPLDVLPVHLVVAGDVAAAGLCEELVAFVHLGDGPLEDGRGLGHLGDHGAHQVGDVLELGHFDHLGVDQDELEFVGLLGVQEAHDDGVHAHRLARAGGAGDEHVGHFGQVGDERLAAGVLAQEHGQLHLGEAVPVGHEFLEADALLGGVGHLDADGVAALHVGDDADVDGLERAGQVGGDRGELGDLGAGGQADVVEGDGRAGLDVDDLAVDAVLAHGGFEVLGLLADEGFELEVEALLGLFEQLEGGELVAVEIVPVLDVGQVLVGGDGLVGLGEADGQGLDLFAEFVAVEDLGGAGDGGFLLVLLVLLGLVGFVGVVVVGGGVFQFLDLLLFERLGDGADDAPGLGGLGGGLDLDDLVVDVVGTDADGLGALEKAAQAGDQAAGRGP